MDGDRNRDAPPAGRRAPRWLEPAAVAALAAAIAAAAVVGDVRRPFGDDEIYTYYAGQASGPGELFRVLSSGGFDASPPLYTVAAWQARRLVGDGELAYRLPATIGFVTMCACLYAFARRRWPAPFAAVAMLVPAASHAFSFAGFARPYGLMLGFAGLALLCWQAAAEGRRRRLALAGLAASLAAATATHYYSVLLLAPLGLAELTRTVAARRGRPDLAVWAAFAFAFAPLPLLAPLMAHSRELARDAPWLRVDPRELWLTYTTQLSTLLPIVLAYGVLALVPGRRAGGAGRGEGGGPPPGELALILGLLALPAVAFALGAAVTRAYSYRYAAPYTAGVALLAAYAGGALFAGRRAVGPALVAVMLASFLKQAGDTARAPADRPWIREIRACAERAGAAGRRLAIPGEFLAYHFYADPATAASLTLVLFGAERQARMLGGLNEWLARKGLATFDMIDGREFFENAGRYHVYGPVEPVRQAAGGRPLAIECPAGAGPVFTVRVAGGGHE